MSILDVEVAHIECVVFDELAARLDYVAHQNRKHFVGIDGVVVVEIDLEEFALLRVRPTWPFGQPFTARNKYLPFTCRCD